MKKTILLAAALCGLLVSQQPVSAAVGTTFTYQGLLTEYGIPATGIYEFRFNLYATDTDLTKVTIGRTNYLVPVTNGLFMTKIDFGDVFHGEIRWLDIGSRTNGSPSDFEPLNPREELTPTPYAIYATTAASVAGNAVTSGSISPGTVVRSLNGLSDAVTLSVGTGASSGPKVSITPSGNTLQILVGGGSATVSGGVNNAVEGYGSTVAGGENNDASGDYSTVSGGYQNSAAGNFFSTVNGGENNSASGDHSTVSGGGGNAASSDYGTIGGGVANNATAPHAVIAGGNHNTISAGASVIGGGQFNHIHAGAVNAVIEGGYNNSVVGEGCTVGGGYHNTASGRSPMAFASSPATVAGGQDNNASGSWSAIPGGQGNTAEGDGSFAAGINAHATHDGSFVWGDGTGGAYSGGPHRFDVLATGGVGFYVPGGIVNIAADGTLSTKVLTITGGSDLAEPFKMSTASVPKGSVVVIDDQHAGQLAISERAYDTRVAGIISGANGINPGVSLSQRGVLDGDQNVALSGRVYVLADATYGAIKPGDLLTTSNTPGYAMKVTDHAKAQGAILGKAMSGLKQGQGMVLVLVTLQ